MSGRFAVETQGAVELVTLDLQARFNALDWEGIDALRDYFLGLGKRTDLRAIILRGLGPAFCAGLDLADWSKLLERKDVSDIVTVQEKASGLIRAMRAAPQPLIGLGHGYACGIGFAMLLACDIRFGAPSLKMNVASVRIGLSGADVGISYLLPKLIGQSRAAEMMLTGRMMAAEEAASIGLLTGIVAEDELLKAGLDKAGQIAANSPLGVRYTKAALAASPATLEEAIALEDRQQILLVGTEDHREAVAAFLAKRKPSFNGR